MKNDISKLILAAGLLTFAVGIGIVVVVYG